MQSLEQIQQALLQLLDKANQKGAFNLEDSNASILALNGLAQIINQQHQVSAMVEDFNNPPIPPDSSKP